MIVILAVALIVVGPDKLPELARSLAKGVAELKRTVNQVKESLNEEGNVLGDVQGELKKTADELQGHLQDPDPKNWEADTENEAETGSDIDLIDLQPLEERPWERDRKKEKDPVAPDAGTEADTPVAPKQDPMQEQQADESPTENKPPASSQ